MEEDNRVCEGVYDSAMYYDCKVCSARCSLRKEKLKLSDFTTLLFFIGIVVFIILKAVGVI